MTAFGVEAHQGKYKTLIVDDHALYRDGLRRLIDAWDDFVVVGEAGNGLEGVEFCKTHEDLDLVLMDVQMPKMDGVEAMAAIHGIRPDLAVLMLTVSAKDDDIFRALKNGARGYVLKDTPSRRLHVRMVDIMEGRGALSATVAGKVIERVAQQSGSRNAGNSMAQVADIANLKASINEDDLDILRLVMEGASNEEIAADLFMSVPSVKKRLSKYMRIFEVENRVQLAVLVSELGITL